ncbi:MAG: hypothetical protein P1U56_22240, partial [Saprospiraceae bacterium]|nr:hypothetical protein [Saprospiraceae bacterium]
MKYLFLVFASILMLSGCFPTAPTHDSQRQEQISQLANDYFATFSERKDWNKLCSFYRNDVEFDDVILQIHLDSLWKFKRFYKWDEEGNHFQKLSPDQEHLTLTSLVVNDSIAVAQGRVNPFYY